MKRITIDDVMSTNPCTPPYTREYVTELFGGRKFVYPLAILKDERIPAEDKLWLLLRDGWLPDRVMHLAACKFAEVALLREREAGREPDQRSWNVIEVKRRRIDGKATDDELDAAWAAAWAARAAAGAAAWAARAAAGAAAWAARAAAGDAARDAARAAWAAWAARAAAGAAAWAARAAAGDAARDAARAAWAAWAARAAAWAAWAAAWAAQVDILIDLIANPPTDGEVSDEAV